MFPFYIPRIIVVGFFLTKPKIIKNLSLYLLCIEVERNTKHKNII